MIKIKKFFLSAISCVGISIVATGCSNKCPKQLVEDAKNLGAMPANSKADFAKGAKACNELVANYKDNDHCRFDHEGQEREFLIEKSKKTCAELETRAK